MASTAESIAALDDFLRDFVTPLVAGGTMHIGRPFSISSVDDFDGVLAEVSGTADVIDDARAHVLAPMQLRPPPMILERDDLALAMGLHNALFLVHPDTDKVGITERQLDRVAAIATSLVSQPLTKDRRRVLARHALLHNLFAITRTDILLSWWTGHSQFHGQPAPKRLLRWKSLRRVDQTEREVSVDELLFTEQAIPIVAALLRRSPFTLLLATHKFAPLLHWEDALWILRDRRLAEALLRVVFTGTGPMAELIRPARLAAAFEQMLERAGEPSDVRAVAAFLCYLSAQLCVRDSDTLGDDPYPLFVAAGAEQARPRGLTLFLALPHVLQQVAPEIAVPPGILSSPTLARRWAVHRAQAKLIVGQPAIDSITQRLAKALGVAIADANPAPTRQVSSTDSTQLPPG